MQLLQGEAPGPAPRPPPLYHSGVWASPEGVRGGCAVGDLAPDTSVPGLFFFFLFFASEELVLRLEGGRN